MKISPAILAVTVAVAGTGCRACRGPAVHDSVAASTQAGATYTPPADGTKTLVEALQARRTDAGNVVVRGRLLLPESTRIWVELYPASSAPDADPVDRAELYLTAGGAFETPPLGAPAASDLRVLITSHFTRSWQGSDVLAAVGAGGMKLPKSALMPNDPNSPLSAAHLEVSQVVKVSGP
jgi:hypothetical protein